VKKSKPVFNHTNADNGLAKAVRGVRSERTMRDRCILNATSLAPQVAMKECYFAKEQNRAEFCRFVLQPRLKQFGIFIQPQLSKRVVELALGIIEKILLHFAT
jgi:hypothetical protein